MKTKKAIAGIITTSLLLVLTVNSVIAYQIWFNLFSSNLNTKIETSDFVKIQIIDFINYDLYIKNLGSNNISLNQIIIGGINCNYEETNLISGVNKIPIVDNKCRWNLSQSNNDIVLISNSDVYSFTHRFEEIYCFTDYNKDETINNTDIPEYVSRCLGKTTDIYPPCVDYNEDGIINNADQVFFISGQYGVLEGKSQKCYKG